MAALGAIGAGGDATGMGQGITPATTASQVFRVVQISANTLLGDAAVAAGEVALMPASNVESVVGTVSPVEAITATVGS